MAKRNLGFLMRQLLVSSNNPGAGVGFPFHHRRHFVSSSTQTLTLTLPCSSIIPSYSLHTLQHRRFLCSWTDSDGDWGPLPDVLHPAPPPPLPPFRYWYWPPGTLPPPPYPRNADLCSSPIGYHKALKEIQDEGLSSVLFFTEDHCRTSSKAIHPLFLDLCNKCKHMTVYVLPLPKTGLFSMHMLGLKSPTFQFYLHGEKVKELSTGSMGRVFKTLENVYRLGDFGVIMRDEKGMFIASAVGHQEGVSSPFMLKLLQHGMLQYSCSNVSYSPSGMKKRIRRRRSKEAKKEEVDPSKLSKVLPSRFHASEVPKVMEALESLPEAKPLSNLWWFARGLFTSHEKRERFSGLEDDRAKLEWLNHEMAE
ncbi:uncharacterized protein [Malus domestica]|uniref:uncharacterized protein isoform X1 n=1 Tax=Malus domestica TaxID=3750 RepID=UPI0010A9D857|nr:uncharacterized protein LOC103434503 isoform X1 [Malus domestica]